MGTLLFVYGELLSTEPQHNAFLSGIERKVEQAWTKGTLYKTVADVPAMVEGTGFVYGEIYEVSDTILRRIDEWAENRKSSNGHLYLRETLEVYTDKGSFQAQVYVFSDKSKRQCREVVPFQDWKVAQYLTNKDLYLYFAYGSCMDHERFRLAGVDHGFQVCIGRGTKHHYALKFTMKGENGNAADIVEGDQNVEGKLYEINEDTLNYLFIREGVEAGHYRPSIVDIENEKGERVQALTFIVIDKQPEGRPTELYVTEILRGGKETLSSTYWEALRNRINKQFNMDIHP
ncbi:gamma-glutamylcyclotransferase (GGCT)/AIG2-like uncharacterized protein YtfP [Pullulanibacillus pueri]|uniref:Putative gamma-glutamylcyclotransferase YkqA n=1 Tax=Pullulanibacillus pueri TaxID=1437324 RepID=A0A8J3EPC8_9BACL|nr:gamma-glutamylcyclotransferase family protein [Pullulanibacillus pueri]MBM7680488.1 gamma-glutamylcyclotransferase (GGCT)/AIG2-like uncharacterized protein YtfP [Pullulanibacillus pueri]GGH88217.1 putative gamma-glutamylcyclotransferase YkqA [Pullulanibacillus pueri]